MKSIVVFILAILLFTIFAPIGFLYTLIKLILNPKILFDWFWHMAVSIDQTGNTVCQELFNDTLIIDGYSFGNPDETVSGVLGKNKLSGSLTTFGKLLDNILEKLEKNHTILAIEEDENKKQYDINN